MWSYSSAWGSFNWSRISSWPREYFMACKTMAADFANASGQGLGVEAKCLKLDGRNFPIRTGNKPGDTSMQVRLKRYRIPPILRMTINVHMAIIKMAALALLEKSGFDQLYRVMLEKH